MFYFLSSFTDYLSALNLFQYITFRAGGAFLTALVVSLWGGNPFINKIQELKVAQTVREYGPASHQVKSGTPTMGGLLILFSMVLATLLWARLDNRFIWLTLIAALYLGLLGFVDDYRKWLKKHPDGGLAKAPKIFFQLGLALGISVYLYFNPSNSDYAQSINIPYLKNTFLILGGLMIPFGLIVMIGTSNAVNLTDGLDGLAVGTVLISSLTFGAFAYLAGHVKFSGYLGIIPVAGAGELTIYLAAMAGACLGFLWYNSYPAQIFMGDTGSLFMGGTIGVVALCIKQELILVVVGGVFVAEIFSVFLQVWSYRFRGGKRILRMAPLHHHFELMGLPETKVTIRFWIVAVVLSLVALTSLKVR